MHKGWTLCVTLALGALFVCGCLGACGIRLGTNSLSPASGGYSRPGITIADFQFAADVNSPTLKLIDSRGSATRDDITLTSSNVPWDSSTKVLSGDVTLKNGTNTLLFNCQAVVETFNLTNASVTSPTGYTSDAKPYLAYQNAYRNVYPNETTTAVNWKFYDPESKNFAF